jgi:hypothetical protein
MGTVDGVSGSVDVVVCPGMVVGGSVVGTVVSGIVVVEPSGMVVDVVVVVVVGTRFGTTLNGKIPATSCLFCP